MRQVGFGRGGIEHVEVVGAEALLDRHLGAFGDFLVDVEVAAARRRERDAQVADGLAGLALLGKDLPEALDLGGDGGLELVVDAVADAELRALGDFRSLRDAGMRGERGGEDERERGNEEPGGG